MKNLFEFDYIEKPLKRVNIACPKESYHIVKTSDVSNLGNAFINKGYDVSTFIHRNGEIIGLNINFGNKPAKVGESQYNLIIKIPNNGSGKGYLAIKQVRLICSNGMVTNKTLHKDN
jgi:hypothetical protein